MTWYGRIKMVKNGKVKEVRPGTVDFKKVTDYLDPHCLMLVSTLKRPLHVTFTLYYATECRAINFFYANLETLRNSSDRLSNVYELLYRLKMISGVRLSKTKQSNLSLN